MLNVSEDTMRALEAAVLDTQVASLEASRQNLVNVQNEIKILQEKLADENISEEQRESWKETMEVLEEEATSLAEEVNSKWSSALETAADNFEKEVNRIMEAFEKANSGIYGSFDAMQEAFNQQKEIGDRYVDDYQKIYELSKLNRDLTNSIDSTDSVKGKQLLKDLQKEINALQESETEMSQHDLDYLRKKYDLKVAEIALEEAQNAKSQVRMRRDLEGNWSYVYTADQQAQENAQQNYEDKLYEIQKLEQDYIEEMEDAAIQAQIDMMNAIQSLRVEDFANEEEYQKKIDEIVKDYTGRRKYAYSEMDKAIQNSSVIYQEDWSKYSSYTGYKISEEAKWIDKFKETTTSMVLGYDSIDAAIKNFSLGVDTMVSELTSAFSSWKSNVETIMKAAGQEVSPEGVIEFGKSVDKEVDTIESRINELNNKLNSLATTTAFEDLVGKAIAKSTEYENSIKPYINANNSLYESFLKLQKIQSELDQKSEDDDNPPPDYTHTGKDETPSPGGPPGPGATTYTGTYTGWSAGKSQVFTATSTTSQKEAEELAKQQAMQYAAEGYVQDTGETMEEALSMLNNGGVAVGNKGVYSIGDEEQKWSEQIAKIRSGLIVAQYDYKEKRYKGLSTHATKTEAIKGAIQVAQSDDTSDYYEYGEDYAKEKLRKENYIDARTGTIRIGTLEDFYDNAKDIIKDFMKFDTGGYTGAWGDSSGRLAVLHQKELILNADDTSNFLTAIEIVRNISRMIDLRATAQQSALAGLTNSIMMPMSSGVQQEITIHAEFPAATNHSEIEEAFNSLLNHASQFANRKK